MRARTLILLTGVLMVATQLHAEESVVWGRATGQALLENNLACGIDTEPMCISHPVYVWTLSVQMTLSGPEIPTRVLAWRRQNSKLPRADQRSYRIFVLEPTQDADERTNMRADYLLRSMSQPHYCIDADPTALGVDSEVVHVEPHDYGDVYCFPLEAPSRVSPTERRIRYVLTNLCRDAGYCIPPKDQDRIARRDAITAPEFAIEVLKADGSTNAEHDAERIDEIAGYFVEKMGSAFVPRNDSAE